MIPFLKIFFLVIVDGDGSAGYVIVTTPTKIRFNQPTNRYRYLDRAV